MPWYHPLTTRTNTFHIFLFSLSLVAAVSIRSFLPFVYVYLGIKFSFTEFQIENYFLIHPHSAQWQFQFFMFSFVVPAIAKKSASV